MPYNYDKVLRKLTNFTLFRVIMCLVLCIPMQFHPDDMFSTADEEWRKCLIYFLGSILNIHITFD